MKERWTAYSEKTKVWITLALMLVVALVAYQGSFRLAVEAMRTQSRMEAERDSLVNLIARQGSPDAAREAVAIAATSLPAAQGELLARLEGAARRSSLAIARVPEFEINEEHGRNVACLQASVEGRFHDQVKLIAHLENDLEAVYLQSAQLQAVYDRRAKRRRLISELEFKAVLK